MPDEHDWKKAAREWETKAKDTRDELEALNGKFAELEAQEHELAAKLAALDSNQARAALIHKVATAAGVPAGVLRGADEAELTAHAQTIKGLMPR
ncbi:hypothetical protein [Paeniglutamicibacter psychrophenolicus]|uniref:hypothetical protein n=1 Tax=Paeniglutamicibacter psychrophenolicus TaxID=257454 RepID=UPI0027836917|nr:hypothetical protein [Paeniglutamicibacter psychrophenolicus]MDQ0094409.1 uncharacterized ferritin-like protein (DUF455 family) [Paeniglutamicibacter psychrophenolicus]